MSAPWRLRRRPASDVRHVELWCEPGPSGPLWETVGSERVDRWRRERREDAEIAAALAAELVPVLQRLRRSLSLDSVYLGGGLLELPGLRRSLGRALPCRFNSDGRFVGEQGGAALAGGETVVVVDVGQTAIKASGGGQRRLLERDLAALPLLLIDPERPPAPSPERTRAAAEFIADGCAEILAAVPATIVILALPGPIGEGPVPGACTYGWGGDRALLPAVLERLEARCPGGGQVLLLNDAELAAESARAELRPAPGARVLSVTLGFGPGAALLAP